MLSHLATPSTYLENENKKEHIKYLVNDTFLSYACNTDMCQTLKTSLIRGLSDVGAMYILLVLTQVNKFPQSSKLYMLKAHA
jgi:hypothetical protein